MKVPGQAAQSSHHQKQIHSKKMEKALMYFMCKLLDGYSFFSFLVSLCNLMPETWNCKDDIDEVSIWMKKRIKKYEVNWI